jgi:hypothetical protein
MPGDLSKIWSNFVKCSGFPAGRRAAAEFAHRGDDHYGETCQPACHESGQGRSTAAILTWRPAGGTTGKLLPRWSVIAIPRPHDAQSIP